MNRSPFQVIGIEQCTIEEQYTFSETLSAPVADHRSAQARQRAVDEMGRIVSLPFPSKSTTVIPSDRVTVRVRDLAKGLRAMAESQLAWIDDLGDDPVVLTRDFYEVFLACQQVRRAG